jgi:hypothetical protein
MNILIFSLTGDRIRRYDIITIPLPPPPALLALRLRGLPFWIKWVSQQI